MMPNHNKILYSKDIVYAQKNIGTKTLNLKRCKDWGFNVPDFIALSNNLCAQIIENEILLNDICEDIHNHLKCPIYAVRSSALIEDTDSQSCAGQFRTECGVLSKDLAMSILNVLKHAKSQLDGTLEQFSLIIQKFIEPDISGVAFTRDPMGFPDIIVEFHRGRGEELVSGSIKPTRTYYLRNQTIPPIFEKEKINIETFITIENLAGFPQDIEWCVTSGEMYILQTRTITTFSKIQNEQFKILDRILPAKKPFYYEKNEISEIAPRPVEFTFDTLQKLYESGGPVDRVYKKYSISYISENFLCILGNELFIDKEKELMSILPSYSYFSNYKLKPGLKLRNGCFKTLKNIFSLSLLMGKINNSVIYKLYNEIKNKIEENKFESEVLKFKDPLDAINNFFRDYELIFEINLLAMTALKNLDYSLKNTTLSSTTIIKSWAKLYLKELPEIHLESEALLGNSLDIANESPFVYSKKLEEGEAPCLEDGSKIIEYRTQGIEYGISDLDYKNNNAEECARNAILLNRLREYGRWLTVIRTNQIRSSLINLAKKKNFSDPRNIYFSTLKEIREGFFNEKTCLERKNKYSKYDIFNFPVRLSHVRNPINKSPIGVSSGISKGTIISLSELKNGKPGILYTDILSPDLVNYFDKIEGIISLEGGILSHLAILARENNIPVVTNFTLTKEIKIGSFIQMNGDTGEISQIN